MYLPLVRDGGIIGFHDLAMGADPGAPKERKVKGFWSDLKHKKYEYYQDTVKSETHGIGYIVKHDGEGINKLITEKRKDKLNIQFNWGRK